MQPNLSQTIGDYFDNVLSKEKEGLDEESVVLSPDKRIPSEFMRLFSKNESHSKPKKKTISDNSKRTKK